MPRVAVIGAGASGYAATRALDLENHFDSIQVYERKAYVGGVWAYEPAPDPFTLPNSHSLLPPPIPSKLTPTTPLFTDPAPPRPNIGNASYSDLDTNSGAQTMAFTHTAFPLVNSADSIRRFGPKNETRPRVTIQGYLERLFEPYLHLVSFQTHVEQIDRLPDDEDVAAPPVNENGANRHSHVNGYEEGKKVPRKKWRLTLRKEAISVGEEKKFKDHWWQEDFDAVVVASGHYTEAKLPQIDGLEETFNVHPDKLIHSKAWRGSYNYTNKSVLIVGSSVSASDIVEDLHNVVSGPLYVTQRTPKLFLQNVFRLPNVSIKPIPTKLTPTSCGITVTFSDGSIAANIERIIFATGFNFDYGFLPWKDAVTKTNRLSGFYQHIFRIGDPTLVVVGQAKAGVTLRVFEYQAICAARFLAGRSQPLPSIEEQYAWEQAQLASKGDSDRFHEIKPDYVSYYTWMQAFVKPVTGNPTYEMPEFEDWWVENDQSILWLKVKYWENLLEGEVREEARKEREKGERERAEEKRKKEEEKETERRAEVETETNGRGKIKANVNSEQESEQPAKKTPNL